MAAVDDEQPDPAVLAAEGTTELVHAGCACLLHPGDEGGDDLRAHHRGLDVLLGDVAEAVAGVPFIEPGERDNRSDGAGVVLLGMCGELQRRPVEVVDTARVDE